MTITIQVPQCKVILADGTQCPNAAIHGRMGHCQTHYYRLRKYGDPLVVRNVQHHGLTLEERLWAQVDRSGGPTACWPWTARSRHRFGYGQMWVRGRTQRERIGLPADGKDILRSAHVLAWILTNGVIPPETPCVLHECDNAPCCNATIGAGHLYLGTQARNIADAIARGRKYNGPFARLTTDDIRSIRRLSAEGLTQPQIAERFGVHRGHIGRIVRRDIWKHVD